MKSGLRKTWVAAMTATLLVTAGPCGFQRTAQAQPLVYARPYLAAPYAFAPNYYRSYYRPWYAMPYRYPVPYYGYPYYGSWYTLRYARPYVFYPGWPGIYGPAAYPFPYVYDPMVAPPVVVDSTLSGGLSRYAGCDYW